MERKEEEELSSGNVSDESSSNQRSVRNLNLDEIISRITAFRKRSQTVAGPSGPSTSTQEWTSPSAPSSSSSAPSTSRGRDPSPPGRRFIIFPEASRPNCPPEMILNQLPAGCVRTGPSSPKRVAGAYLHPLLGFSPDEEASTSHYNYQHLSSPVYPHSPKMLSPKVTPRKTSSPGHPFGLGSKRSSRSQSAKDSVPIESVKSDFKEKPGIFVKKDKTGEAGPGKSIEKDGHGEPSSSGGHGEPDIKGK